MVIDLSSFIDREISWPYIAGVFDGEGSGYIGKKGEARFSISNTNLEMLNAIKSFLNLEGIKATIKGYYRRRNPVFTLCVSRHIDCLRFGRRVKPYTIVKAGKIGEIITHIKRRNWRYMMEGIPRDVLAKLYWDKELSTDEIARIFRVSDTAVSGFMDRHFIPRRTHDERMKLAWKKYRPIKLSAVMGNLGKAWEIRRNDRSFATY